MHEVEDETIGAGVPVLLGIWDGFQWNHGCEQFVPQGGRDQLVRFPDALGRANLESDICQFRYIMLAEESYFCPSLRITQRCISMEFPEHIIDLDIGVRTGEGLECFESYHGGGQFPKDPGFFRVNLFLSSQKIFSPFLNNHLIFHLLPPVGLFPNMMRQRTHP